MTLIWSVRDATRKFIYGQSIFYFMLLFLNWVKVRSLFLSWTCHRNTLVPPVPAWVGYAFGPGIRLPEGLLATATASNNWSFVRFVGWILCWCLWIKTKTRRNSNLEDERGWRHTRLRNIWGSLHVVDRLSIGI